MSEHSGGEDELREDQPAPHQGQHGLEEPDEGDFADLLELLLKLCSKFRLMQVTWNRLQYASL